MSLQGFQESRSPHLSYPWLLRGSYWVFRNLTFFGVVLLWAKQVPGTLCGQDPGVQWVWMPFIYPDETPAALG